MNDKMITAQCTTVIVSFRLTINLTSFVGGHWTNRQMNGQINRNYSIYRQYNDVNIHTDSNCASDRLWLA